MRQLNLEMGDLEWAVLCRLGGDESVWLPKNWEMTEKALIALEEVGLAQKLGDYGWLVTGPGLWVIQHAQEVLAG